MAMGRGLIVPRAHVAVVPRKPSSANALMPVRTGCSSARTLRRRARTESHERGRNATGADDIFSGTFRYIRRARTFLRQAQTETTRALTGVDGI
jgi:hypothetical protein